VGWETGRRGRGGPLHQVSLMRGCHGRWGHAGGQPGDDAGPLFSPGSACILPAKSGYVVRSALNDREKVLWGDEFLEAQPLVFACTVSPANVHP